MEANMKQDQSMFAARNGRKRFPAALLVTFLFSGLALLAALPGSLAAQDWFRTGTGLGVSKPRVAVADFAPRTPTSQGFATEFSEVVRADLDFSGILELVSKSFNPLQT